MDEYKTFRGQPPEVSSRDTAALGIPTVKEPPPKDMDGSKRRGELLDSTLRSLATLLHEVVMGELSKEDTDYLRDQIVGILISYDVEMSEDRATSMSCAEAIEELSDFFLNDLYRLTFDGEQYIAQFTSAAQRIEDDIIAVTRNKKHAVEAAAEKIEQRRANLIAWAESIGYDEAWVDSKFDISVDGISCNDLNLSRSQVKTLPEGLHVNRNLDLRHCTLLESLPEGLTVGGSLYLYNCTSLVGLPEKLNVHKDLDLSGCTSLKSLPNGLTVGLDLFLNRCTSLESLPEGLTVGRDLFLGQCIQLTTFPDSATVGIEVSIPRGSWINKIKFMSSVNKAKREGRVKKSFIQP